MPGHCPGQLGGSDAAGTREDGGPVTSRLCIQVPISGPLTESGPEQTGCHQLCVAIHCLRCGQGDQRAGHFHLRGPNTWLCMSPLATRSPVTLLLGGQQACVARLGCGVLQVREHTPSVAGSLPPQLPQDALQVGGGHGATPASVSSLPRPPGEQGSLLQRRASCLRALGRAGQWSRAPGVGCGSQQGGAPAVLGSSLH